MTVVTKLTLIQFVFTLVITGLFLLIFDVSTSMSAFLGGVICVLANLFFAGKLFLGQRITDPKIMLRQFYRSEAMKFLFTLTMFVLVLLLIDVRFWSFIVAYGLTAFLNWLCLPWLQEPK